MSAFEGLKGVILRGNELLLQVMDDTTAEQAAWQPPGTANSMGQTYDHIVKLQDRYLNEFILGQPLIWERDGWAERLGLPDEGMMSPDREKARVVDPAAYRPYAAHVFDDTRAYLERTDEAELAREVVAYGRPMPVGVTLGRHLAFHLVSHLGEICAVKGVQGLKGLPF